MNEQERASVERYLARVRAGLTGLPAADIDDTVAEMRTHIFEEIGERGDPDAVLADFGDAAEVASEIVERRLRPEDEPPVPAAPLGVRYSAWATDVVIGFGPLVLVPTLLSFPFIAAGIFDTDIVPIWVLLVGVVLEHWVMSPAELSSVNGAAFTQIPPWQWVLLVVLLGWAAFYWLVLRRRHSSSVGMWMTQLRGVRVNDQRVVVRERDISQKPAPLGAGKNRWLVLLPAIPTGCLCIMLALYYVTFGVGSFLQPWDAWAQPFEERADFERELELVTDLTGALNDRDASATEALTDGVDAEVLDGLLEPGSGTYEFATMAPDGRFIIAERVSDTQRRDIYVTIAKEESAAAHDYVESYRIVDIAVSPEVLPVDAPPRD